MGQMARRTVKFGAESRSRVMVAPDHVLAAFVLDARTG